MGWQCKNKLKRLGNSDTDKKFTEAFTESVKCLINNNKGATRYTITGPMYANTGSHHPAAKGGDGYKRMSIIPSGIYRLKEGWYRSKNMKVPAITALYESEAGRPTKNRSAVWIHGSYGNYYKAPTKEDVSGAQETQGCFAFINGHDRFIYNRQQQHEGCGGLYMIVVDMGNATAAMAEAFRKAAEYNSFSHKDKKSTPSLPIAIQVEVDY